MATVIGVSSTGAGIQYNLGAAGDDLNVLAGANIASNDERAITGTGSFHTVVVAGAVFGASAWDAVQLGTGIFDSYNAVVVLAGGLIFGGDDGIELHGGHATVRNHGAIYGTYGVTFAANESSGDRLYNSGSIDAAVTAVYAVDAAELMLTNYGTISGDDRSLDGSDTGWDYVRNRGTMVGVVYLNGGDDTFDNRGGHVEGAIFGGEGNDVFLPGADAEYFGGGGGVDTADYSGTSAVTAYLDGVTKGEGGADGDILGGIDVFKGSRQGADTVYGGVEANTLYGLGGKDWLSGGAGKDTLVGGAGFDTLNGGTGNDRFVFNSPSDGVDAIGDFKSFALGNDDVIAFHASAYGGALALGGIGRLTLISRSDTHAQDADDHFILRTTDTTLWYDVDGSGSAGPQMIADLQAGATMTYRDILII